MTDNKTEKHTQPEYSAEFYLARRNIYLFSFASLVASIFYCNCSETIIFQNITLSHPPKYLVFALFFVVLTYSSVHFIITGRASRKIWKKNKIKTDSEKKLFECLSKIEKELRDLPSKEIKIEEINKTITYANNIIPELEKIIKISRENSDKINRRTSELISKITLGSQIDVDAISGISLGVNYEHAMLSSIHEQISSIGKHLDFYINTKHEIETSTTAIENIMKEVFFEEKISMTVFDSYLPIISALFSIIISFYSIDHQSKIHSFLDIKQCDCSNIIQF
ncbi:MAG: hypothetical protein LCH61_11670 [Proteobacteria bacterium]|nr:hypothetical protein [Pseudomonadota bacterium]